MGYPSSYLLVTPVREDADQLDDLVATMRAQERRPALWLIIDDGSGDDTMARIERISARLPWVHGVALPRLPNGECRSHAELVTRGLRTATEFAEAERIDHHYMVHVDADLRCAPQLMAEIIARCERDRSVGIASCVITEVGDDGRVLRTRDVVDGVPRADLRVWRRECVEELGMRPVPRWAESTGVRARNRGWRTPIFDDLAVEASEAGVLRGGLRGFRKHGAEGWQVGLHPLVLAERAVAASVHDRDLRGVAMVAGYVEAAISGRRRSQDPELREYFGDDLLEERARRLLSRVPMVGRRFSRRR